MHEFCLFVRKIVRCRKYAKFVCLCNCTVRISCSDPLCSVLARFTTFVQHQTHKANSNTNRYLGVVEHDEQCSKFGLFWEVRSSGLEDELKLILLSYVGAVVVVSGAIEPHPKCPRSLDYIYAQFSSPLRNCIIYAP